MLNLTCTIHNIDFGFKFADSKDYIQDLTIECPLCARIQYKSLRDRVQSAESRLAILVKAFDIKAAYIKPE